MNFSHTRKFSSFLLDTVAVLPAALKAQGTKMRREPVLLIRKPFVSFLIWPQVPRHSCWYLLPFCTSNLSIWEVKFVFYLSGLGKPGAKEVKKGELGGNRYWKYQVQQWGQTIFVFGSGVLFRPWQSIPLNGDGTISLIRPQTKVCSFKGLSIWLTGLYIELHPEQGLCSAVWNNYSQKRSVKSSEHDLQTRAILIVSFNKGTKLT